MGFKYAKMYCAQVPRVDQAVKSTVYRAALPATRPSGSDWSD